MRIDVQVDERAPPVGFVRVDEGPPVPFVGWLGLLRILSEAMGEDTDSGWW